MQIKYIFPKVTTLFILLNSNTKCPTGASSTSSLLSCFGEEEATAIGSLSSWSSVSDPTSCSHHGEAASPSEAVWNEDDLDGGVQVHSEAVTNSSSDLLLSSVDNPFDEELLTIPPALLIVLYHSYNKYRPKTNKNTTWITKISLNW